MLALAPAAFAVTLPFHDPFSYADGNLNAVATPTWVVGNGSSTFEIAVSNAAALTAPAGFPAASAKGVRRAPSGTSRRCVLQYDSVPAADGATVFVSFLLNVQTAPAGNEVIGYLDNNLSSQGSPQCGIFVTSGPRVGIGKKSSAPGFVIGNDLSAGTHLVVARYTFQAGNDRVDLWVDPSSADFGAATAPASLGGATGATEPPSLDYFQLVTSAGAGSVMFVDEFRVGRTWAEVVPAGGPVTGTKLGFTTQPASAQVGTTMNPVVVQVQDASGAAAASNGVPVTLALTTGSGTLTGTLTRDTDASGQATFGDLSIDATGTGKQLTATASGIGAGLAAAVSGTFSITDTPVVSGLVITQAVMTQAGFRVAGSTDQPGGFTQILGSSDAGREQTNWLIVAYQNAGAGGEVAFTNPVSPALPHAVYRLRTGDNVTKLEPPSIGIPPASQIVSPGAPVTFTVTATGPQLQYLWFFNGSPIPGATTSALTISNAQAGNVGNYSVAVANPAGNVNSTAVMLGVGNVAPDITAQPQDQTNNAGGTAIFVVTATGTAPLGYQWFFNTNSPVVGGTSATLTVSGLSTNDAGNYRVVVTNAFGSATSRDAALTVNPVPTGLPETNLLGWAAYAGVTGGAGGTETVVTTYAALRAAVRQAGPLIIRVQGALVASEDYCYVEGYDKTIVGDGTDAALYGAGLRVGGTNIIIANLYFSATNHSQADGVTIDESGHGRGRNVWVDHCTFFDCRDGSVDVTKGADYVTVSWCKFSYAPVAAGVVNHEFVNLLGSSDSDDAANYHVTFHHNWYGPYCRERMPSVRFGRAHVFNNYYDCVGNNYCVRTRLDAEVLVEHNYFLGVQNPWERFVTGTPGSHPGWLKATGNITNNCAFVNGWTSGASVIPGDDTLGSELNPPPYTQSPFYWPPPTLALDVPYYVQTYSGTGKYPYAP